MEEQIATNAGSAMRKIYLDVLDNMHERAECEVGRLADRITEVTDTDEVLALQQSLKRARRKLNVLATMCAENLRPIVMQQIIEDVADPEVGKDLQPMFDVITDVREALGLTVADLVEARHE